MAHRRRALGLGFGCMMLAAWALAAHGAAHTIPKTEAAPVVDGDLSDRAWESAARFGPFLRYQGRVDNPTKQPAAVQSTALALYDDEALYIGVRCQEPDTKGIVAQDRERDAAAHLDDSVELFLAPGNRRGHYYHFVVNARNARVDQRNWGSPLQHDYAWDGEWQSATNVAPGQAWTAEMAIPWYNFAADLDDGTWRFNICRSRRVGGETEYSSVAFVTGSFHSIEEFAVLAAPNADFARLRGLDVADVRVPAYALTEEGYAYEVTGTVLNDADQARRVLVELTDRPADGEPSRVEVSVQVPAREAAPFRVTLPMPSPGTRTLKLRLLEPEGRRVLYVNAYAPETYPKMLTAFLDRHLYTDEKEARALFTLNIPGPKDAFVARVRVRADGEDITENSAMVTGDPTAVTVDLAQVPESTHPVRLEVYTDEGRPVAAQETVLRKQPPAPPGVREVKVDREQLCLRVDGEPLFPIGIYGVPERHLSTVAAVGFNIVLRWGTIGRPEDRCAYHQAAHEAGLYSIEVPTMFSTERLGYAREDFYEVFDAFIREELPGLVQEVRNEPSLLMYYGPDEPPHDETAREAVRFFNETVRQNDPYHPNQTLFCVAVPDWKGVYDVASMDFYGIGYKAPMIAVYEEVREQVSVTDRLRVPYVHVPLMEWCSASRRFLTGPMQTTQAYLAVIGGAKGIEWWIWPPRYKGNWQAIQRLGRELSALAPVLVQAIPQQEILYADRAMEDTVKLLVKAHEDKTYLIACNASPAPVQASLQLPKGYGGEARVWFEERELPVTDGALSDRFDGYGRHVYELGQSWPSGGTVTLDIETLPMPDKAAAREAEEPQAASRNLVVDPGLESGRMWRFSPGDPDQGGVTGAYTTERVNSGERAFAIKRPHGQGRAELAGWPVALEPRTQYVFGAYAMSMGGKASIDLLAPYPEGADLRRMHGIMVQDRTLGYMKYEMSFMTKDIPLRVTPVLRYEGGAGQAWFDDVFLYVDKRLDKNLAFNTGFERMIMPGWPDGWTSGYSIMDPGFIGAEDAPWALDEAVVHSGRYSLRMRREQDDPDEPEAFQYKRPEFPAGDYVLSAWLKADRPNLRLYLWVSWTGDTVRVGPEWKRYTVPIHMETGGRKHIQIRMRDAGTVWIDDVQLERGTEATPYAPGR